MAQVRLDPSLEAFLEGLGFVEAPGGLAQLYQSLQRFIIACACTARGSDVNLAPEGILMIVDILQAALVLAKSRSAEGGSPLPEREGSSPFPFLPAAAGGKRENWKALQMNKF